MSDLVPPMNTPLPASDDLAHDIADILQGETWPSVWPRTISRYPTTAARDADLAGLGTTDRAYAWVDALACITTWTGSVWRPAPVETFAGAAISGTYNSTKPIHHLIARKIGTSATTTGYSNATPMPTGTTTILAVTLGMGMVTGHTILLRSDIGLPSNLTFQIRDSASPYNPIGGIAYDFSHDIAYQT